MYLEELQSILPQSLKEYQESLEKKAACERYVEKIMEAATDVAFLTIKQKKLRIPEDDADAFTILQEENIIDDALAKSLKEAKGMKNILAHQYAKVDDTIIFEAITAELPRDIKKFIKRLPK